MVMRKIEDGSVHFLYIKEGVTQGDPLAMNVYRIWVLLFTRELWYAHHCVTQPRYADDMGAGGWGGKFGRILVHF